MRDSVTQRCLDVLSAALAVCLCLMVPATCGEGANSQARNRNEAARIPMLRDFAREFVPALSEAVVAGDAAGVEEALVSGADVNEPTSHSGLTPLHFAAQNGELAIMRLLLERGAVVDAVATAALVPRTPLTAAAGDLDLEAMALLLRHGARPGGVDSRSVGNFSQFSGDHIPNVSVLSANNRAPGKRALQIEALRLLLEHGIDIDAEVSRGTPALFLNAEYAVARPHPETLRMLLHAGADASVLDRNGLPLLRYLVNEPGVLETAVAAGLDCSALAKAEAKALKRRRSKQEDSLFMTARNPSLAGLLVRGRGVRLPSLHRAALSGPKRLAKILSDGTDTDPNARGGFGVTALSCAALTGNVDSLALLLEAGAGVDLADEKGYTALFYAAACNHVDAVRFLLGNGANPERLDASGGGVVLAVAGSRCPDALALLLDVVADPDLVVNPYPGLDAAARLSLKIRLGLRANFTVVTPLAEAVLAGERENARLLLDKGADASVELAAGEPLLYHALANDRPDIAELLVEYGARAGDSIGFELLAALASGVGVDAAAYYIELGGPLESLPSASGGRVHFPSLALRSNPALLEALVERGADIERLLLSSSGDEADPLFTLAYEPALFKRKKLERAIWFGADVNARDGRGRTPVHYAAAGNNPVALNILLESGARLGPRDENALTPLDVAADLGCRRAVEWLSMRQGR